MTQWELCAFADEADTMLAGQIAALRDNRIGVLEIRGINGKSIAALTTAEARAVRRELDDAGIRVWSIGSPTGKIGITDAFAPHRDSFRHMVELADILGASRYRLFSFYGCDDSAATRDTVMERLSSFVEDAKGSGLVLCHENEKNIYGEMAAACQDIHRSIPAIRAVFDPANFVQAGQDTREAWDMLSPYVEYVHIKDAQSDGRVVPAGDGAGNIPWIIEQYSAKGGRVLTLEPHLSDFVGLQSLEGEEKSVVGGLAFASTREAFDAAVQALRRYIG